MNITFSAYAEHQQDLEDAVNILVNAIRSGETECKIQFETEVSDEDIAWVKREAKRRLR